MKPGFRSVACVARLGCVLLALAAQPLLAASSPAQIAVDGAPRAVAAVIRGYLEDRGLDCSRRTRAHRRAVVALARDALDALGYFDARSQLVYPAQAQCTLQVQLGERVTLTRWEVQWDVQDEDPDTRSQARKLLPSLPVAFDPQAYNAIKQDYLTVLTDAGYIDARFIQADVEVDLEKHQAYVAWQVETGPRYTVAPLRIEQSVLSDALIRRFIEFEEGDFLVNRRVLQTYDNLVSSDYFSTVRVTPALDQRANGRVPVNITATPAHKWSYLAGPGFATDTGPRLRAEANARFLNRAGHRVGFSSLLSPVAGNAKAEYRWPYGHPSHEWYGLETRYSYEDTDTAKSDTLGLGLRRTNRLSRHWTQTTYIDYRVEDYDVSAQDGRSQLLLLGGNVNFNSSIDAPRPRKGRRFSIDLRGGVRGLLSDNDVLQLRVSAKQILPFFGASRILARAEAGYSWQEDFSELPASLRFFTGGDRSVRGYALESLGEEDETGRVIGGDRLYVGSLELDVPVRERWSVALFTDVGTAFLDKPNFAQSFGVGLRWYSPLGPIRVDLAHPMQDSDQSLRLHISLGPDI